MRENRTSGSEGGGTEQSVLPTPIFTFNARCHFTIGIKGLSRNNFLSLLAPALHAGRRSVPGCIPTQERWPLHISPAETVAFTDTLH